MTYQLSNANYQKQEQHGPTWGRSVKTIWKRMAANPKVLATFFKAIIQNILLYESKSGTISKMIMHK
jgi:hypothetical protein